MSSNGVSPPRLQTNAGAPWQRRASLALMAASGLAALGYEIVWTQQCAVWLGHEAAAVLAVVAAFFGGLAVGAFALGPRIEQSPRPVRWYAGCELMIASWSLVLALGMTPFSAWLLALTGAQPAAIWQWTIAFFGTFVLLLPATAAMGATLPAMERLTAELRSAGRSIAPLYAANTFGAVLGVLAIAFWLAPTLGLVRTAGVCIVLNLLCGGASLVVFPRSAAVAPAPTARDSRVVRGVLASLAITGLLGIGYEVLVVRVLSQVAEDTVYTFAMLLAVYLVGTAAGAASYDRWLARSRAADELGDRLLCALAAAVLVGTSTLWAAEHVKAAALRAFGPSMSAAVGAEALLALAAFGAPTIVMGAVFSHLSARASAAGVSFGRALGANTLGAAAAPWIFGVLALPALGPKLALLSTALAYLVLTARAAWRMPVVWVPALAVLAIAMAAPPLAFVDVPAGGRVASYRDGVMAAVSVVEDANGVARLRIDNRQQEGSSATLRVDARLAWLPVLLHPAPRRVLFLGLGTGNTAAAAAADSTLEVDAVELLPEVISASAYFADARGEAAPNPRLRLLAADARRYVRASDRRYDVIVSDNFHPARSGSGALYTVEHFAAVRERLDAGGLFCQWLPLHQLDLDTLRSIVKSFVAVYPDAAAMLASNSLETPVLGLVGRADGTPLDVPAVRDRLVKAAARQKLADFGIEDELALLGSFVAGPSSLRRFAGAAAANTDDRPVVAYRAPRITYMPTSLPRDRLLELLGELSIDPAEVLGAADETSRRRVAAYWKARNLFIEAGRDVRPSADPREMLAQVREPLLAVLRVSPDFRPAYDPLLLMATALGRVDVASARALLTQLSEIQPARSDAGRALEQIGATDR
ncbi:MAG TPA: fused MFS/spermidine synthase [Gammaproteobacteria bacterium]|nr:fused MFS/spermidine synthase [Gammaproteobacteria bacterium]